LIGLFSSIQLRLQENLAILDTYDMVQPTMRQPLSAAGYLFFNVLTASLEKALRKFGRGSREVGAIIQWTICAIL
jgi:hypothetical protein